MRRPSSLLLAGAFSAPIAAGLPWPALAETPPPPPPASGPATTQTVALASFNRVDISGAADITLVQSAEESLTVEAQATNDEATVSAKVSGKVLSLQMGSGWNWWDGLMHGRTSGRPRITVHFKELEAINASGDVKIVAGTLRMTVLKVAGSGGTSLRIDDLRAQTLRLSGSGAIKAEVGGRVTDQHIAISGAGVYRAEKLGSDEASVSVSGAGRVTVAVEKTLRVSISGAGVVEYIGNPTVKEDISGAGRVKRRDSADATPEEAAPPRIALNE